MKNRWKALGIASGLAIGLTPFFIVYRFDQESERRADRARAALQSYGYAVTLEAFLALKPDGKDNAAPLYLSILKEVHERKLSKELSTAGTALSAKEIAMLDREKALLDRVDRVRLRPRLWFDRPYEQGWDVLMPELAQMKQMQQLLGRRAILDAQRGDSQRARERLVTMTAVAEQGAQDPSLIGGLVSRSLFMIRDRDALIVASKLEAPEDRVRIRRLIESAPLRFNVEKHLSGDSFVYSLDRPLTPEMVVEDSGARFLYSTPVMKRRITAVNLEMLAYIASRSQDGLDNDDVRDIENFDRNRSQGVLDDLSPLLAPVVGSSMTVEYQTNHRTLLLTAFDVLAQQAGGPAAKIPIGYKLEKKGDQFAILGPTQFVLVAPAETSMGNIAGWKGFKP